MTIKNKNLTNWLKAVDAVYRHNGFSREAIFVHGWSDLISETGELVGELYKEAGSPLVVLNSLGGYGLGGSGYKELREGCVKAGVSESRIIVAEAARQTREEAEAFMDIAAARQIKSATIVSVPQHIFRAFLTNLGVMRERKFSLLLHPRTISPEKYDWLDSYDFVSPMGEGRESATRLARFAAECLRIIEYGDKTAAGDKNYMISDIEDALLYIRENWGK